MSKDEKFISPLLQAVWYWLQDWLDASELQRAKMNGQLSLDSETEQVPPKVKPESGAVTVTLPPASIGETVLKEMVKDVSRPTPGFAFRTDTEVNVG